MDVTDLKKEMAHEKTERRREYNQMQAALQAFRDRDGVWLELWHDQNVALSAAGLPTIQLPDKLKKWPEVILTSATSSNA